MSHGITRLRGFSESLHERTNSKFLRLLIASARLTPSHDTSVQFIRSLVVSVIALCFDFGSLVLLKEKFGVQYLLAAAIGFCIGVVVNYVLSVVWVFANRKFTNKHAEFTIFFIICAVGLALNLGIIAALVQIIRMDYRLAKAIATIVVFFWNFVARKKILY